MMEFTYKAYREMINSLKEAGYEFCDYADWEKKKMPVILRHDIDYDVKKALGIAEIESGAGISSTWFVLLTSSLYNVYSKKLLIFYMR